MNFTVSIQVDADTAEAAAAVVDGWTLSEGVIVLSIIGVPQYTEGLPLEIGGDGSVKAAADAAKAAADSSPDAGA